MKRIFTIIAVVVVALAGAGVMLAQATANPFVGTWKLNLAKSKFTGAPPKSETRTVEAQGNGLKVTYEGIAADGSAIAFSFTTNLDGKPVPFVGTVAGADMFAVKRIDSNTYTGTATKAGKEVGTTRTVVSKDGKVTTITTKATDANGQPISDVAVWDKQ